MSFDVGSVVTVDEPPGGPPGERVTVNPTQLDFGAVDVGATARKKLRIANIGFWELSVSDVIVSGAASVFGSYFTAPFALGPLSFVELTMTFRPDAAIDYEGLLAIVTDDETATVPLAGHGE